MTNLFKPLNVTMLLLLAGAVVISCAEKASKDDFITQPDTSEAEIKLPTTYTYTPHNSDEFTKLEHFSEDFNSTIDEANWEICTDAFAVWSFKTENVRVEDGDLNLTAKYDYHMPGSTQFYFSSGMLRSREPVVYGYYEARIKGADVWPGVCPAFWLYSMLDKASVLPREENTLVYNEIDVIEIQQIASNKRMMACNMHVMVLLSDGEGGFTNDFVTAGILPEMGQNEFLVDWDAEDDYHLYACENRPDSVVFYIDNERVASKPNYFWHLDMYLTLSMGMRTPYETYVGGRQPVATTEEAATAAGFPTDMKIDYIRSYTRDYSQFASSSKPFDRTEFE